MITERQIYRAVAGAVKNTADGHPGWGITKVMRHSIAKRATGTLVAANATVLAASPSHGRLGINTNGRGQGLDAASAPDMGPMSSPMRKLVMELSLQVGQAKIRGDSVRACALIEVLRLIDSLKKGDGK